MPQGSLPHRHAGECNHPSDSQQGLLQQPRQVGTWQLCAKESVSKVAASQRKCGLEESCVECLQLNIPRPLHPLIPLHGFVANEA